MQSEPLIQQIPPPGLPSTDTNELLWIILLIIFAFEELHLIPPPLSARLSLMILLMITGSEELQRIPPPPSQLNPFCIVKPVKTVVESSPL